MITETSQESATDQALRESETRYRRLFEASRDGILIVDAVSGTITDVNPFLADLLGYSREEILHKKLWELSPFEDTQKSELRLEQLQNQEYVRYDDLPLKTRDGRLIAVEFVSNTYQSGNDRVIQCNIRDLTERKRATRAQQSSEDRYRALFDYAPDGIVIADRQSRYVDANPSICRMLGYSKDELVGMHASDIVVPSEVPHIDPALAAIAERTAYHREWEFRRKDGSAFRADVMATAMPDGSLLGMIRDLTERNLADETLRHTEERMRFALQNAQVGIWDMDYVTGELRWSDLMEVQYGLKPGTFAGTFPAFLECIHPDDVASVTATIAQAMTTGSDFTVQHRTNGRDGGVRWLSGTGRILLDDAGQPKRAVGISQDVTEQHRLQAKFQQAQKMEAVGRLAGGVAHDFNNLLTVILGFCELLLMAGCDGDPDQRQLDLEEIQQAAQRAAELTHQLLAFSRKQIIEPTLLDLNVLIAAMKPMLERLIREDVKVLIGARSTARFKADKGQVEQVVLNLVVNAQDAMPRGGTLTIESADVELDEHYAALNAGVTPGPYVVLSVTDSGVGMTADLMEHLFEPFFTTKEVGKGTGLGLATVHGIATRGGGSVSVYSEVGRGTSIKVYFPRSTSEEVVETRVQPPPLPHGEETILIVEDAEGLRELTKRLLERQGYTVIVAANAGEAIRRFDENSAIGLILTDVVMPGLSGPDLAKELIKRRPGLKVVYMSGYTDDAIVEHGVLLPGIAFIHKPFTADSLGRKIREVFDRAATSAAHS